jgi:hypothetical protein
MKKYTVYAVASVTKTIGTFEANSEEEAVQKGKNDPNCYAGSLCAYCAREYDVGEINEVFAEEE